MDFFVENLKEVLNAVNKKIENHRLTINTRNIRRLYDIESSNRSKISFIWRSLQFLEQEGILTRNNGGSPKNYLITSQEKINVERFISQVRKKRSKHN